MDLDALRTAGWEPLTVTPRLARSYGYPAGTTGYRKPVSDGVLVAIVGHDDNGHAFALSHVPYFDADDVFPRRLPTFVELYAARRVLVPPDALMVAVLEPMSYALRLRRERAQTRDPLPSAPGLPPTLKCVQLFVEAVTDEVGFAPQDSPNPAARLPRVARADRVRRVPDERLGEDDRPAVGGVDDEPPDDGGSHRDGAR